MDRYLTQLHKKSPHHKKRFALVASGMITLFIFGLWSVATFGISGINTDFFTRKDRAPVAEVKVENEISPLESLWMNMAASFRALSGSFGELRSSLESGLEPVDFEAEYKEIQMGTLEIYGE